MLKNIVYKAYEIINIVIKFVKLFNILLYLRLTKEL